MRFELSGEFNFMMELFSDNKTENISLESLEKQRVEDVSSLSVLVYEV